ncbi:DUF342 domain-containing protein [Chitinimonas sp.]|uniref:DUF342 domain-containing protein n=1 Tax=Chitinimonas sp. TaxID=1934313 RepID=UPI0035AFC78D
MSLIASEDANSHAISISFDLDAEGETPDAAAIHAVLADAGLDQCFIDASAVEAFVAQCKAARQARSEIAPEEGAASRLDAIVGQRRNGSVEVKLAPDRMTAWMTLLAPQGGKSVSVGEVNAAIKARGIVHGLMIEVLNEVILAGSCIDRTIAVGTEPIPGIDAHFDSLLEEIHASRHEDNQYAEVDYRDLGNLLLVEAGVPIMRRVPAVPGKSGMNVCGQIVPVKPTPDPGFAKGLVGVEADASDPNLLRSAIAGQPKIVDGGAIVNTVVVVDEVNLASGNVVFDGTLNVKGDIHAGMSVRVAGDVIVEGTIEAAKIVAGGDVSAKGGIVGRAESAQGALETAHIECNGSVQAKFAEYAHVQAGKAITLETAARQSELFASDTITVGKGAGLGQIVGGQARALMMVRAGTLGSSSGTPTVIQVGFDPRLNVERINIEQTRKRKLDDGAKIRQLLAFLDKNPGKGQGGVREKAEKTRDQIDAEVAQYDARLQQLAEQIELAEGASIVIGKAIYSGVNLQVGQKLLQVMEDRGACRIRLKDDKIVLG